MNLLNKMNKHFQISLDPDLVLCTKVCTKSVLEKKEFITEDCQKMKKANNFLNHH